MQEITYKFMFINQSGFNFENFTPYPPAVETLTSIILKFLCSASRQARVQGFDIGPRRPELLVVESFVYFGYF